MTSSTAMYCALPIEQSEIKFDMKASMIATILTWLDAMGKLKFDNLQISGSCDIAFTNQSLDTLRKSSKIVLSCAKVGKRAKGVLNVPLDALATLRGDTVHKCIEHLSEAEEQLGLKLDFKDNSYIVELNRTWRPEEIDEIIDEIAAKVKNMETSNLGKIDAMYRLIAEDLDIPVAEKIRRYFENPAPQGPSSLGIKSSSSILIQHYYHPTEMTRSHVTGDVKNFLSLHSSHITSARQVARIFHGISSPLFPKEQWMGNRYWSKSVHIPFDLILSIAQEQLVAALLGNATL